MPANNNTIPKIVHYVWMGKNPKPELVLNCIESWKKNLSEYQIIEWNENNFDMHYNPYLEDAYKQGFWAFVSDVVRTYVVNKYGGIYMDTDLEVLKPLDRFLEHEAFCGSQSGNGYQVSAALLASKRGGDWIGRLSQLWENKAFTLPDGRFNLYPAPKYFTELMMKDFGLVPDENLFQDLGSVVVYPKEYFFASNWATNEYEITKNTYAVHHNQNSWIEKAQSFLKQGKAIYEPK